MKLVGERGCVCWACFLALIRPRRLADISCWDVASCSPSLARNLVVLLCLAVRLPTQPLLEIVKCCLKCDAHCTCAVAQLSAYMPFSASGINRLVIPQHPFSGIWQKPCSWAGFSLPTELPQSCVCSDCQALPSIHEGINPLWQLD